MLQSPVLRLLILKCRIENKPQLILRISGYDCITCQNISLIKDEESYVGSLYCVDCELHVQT